MPEISENQSLYTNVTLADGTTAEVVREPEEMRRLGSEELQRQQEAIAVWMKQLHGMSL